jgi:lysozyme
METNVVAPAAAAGGGPTAPPANVANMPLGFDISEDNGPKPPSVADFEALRTVGKIFGILKVAQNIVDGQFDVRYPLVSAAGLIRGSYDFFAPQDVATQSQAVVDHVKRLTPGDLAPALDLEDQSAVLDGKYNYSAGMAGRQNLFNDIVAWLNDVEKQLGRTPVIYTGVLWREQFSAANFPDLPDVNGYALWVAHPSFVNQNAGATGEVLRGWSDYSIWQYAEDKRGDKKKGKPAQLWGVDPYVEPGTEKFDGIDYNAFNGTIYGLRGLADIGRPGVVLDGNDPYIAHSEIEGHLHLLAHPSGWTDSDLSAGNFPSGGEDPALVCSSGTLFLYFRTEGHLIETTLGSGTAWKWDANQIEDAKPIHDPRAVVDGDKRYVVYWADDDDWYLMTFAGSWSSSGGILRAANLGKSTGQPAVYVTQGVVHVVGRVDADGDLFDVWRDDSGSWKSDNVSASARNLNAAMPGATYSPCAFETSGGVGIAFRAVGGHLWVVTRSDNAPTDLTATIQNSPAAGHPTCFVLQDKPHIVYRGVDNLIHEIWLESGSWHSQQVCDMTVASDPVAATNGTVGLVGVRGTDGMIHAARFDGTGWTCDPTTMATLAQSSGSQASSSDSPAPDAG